MDRKSSMKRELAKSSETVLKPKSYSLEEYNTKKEGSHLWIN